MLGSAASLGLGALLAGCGTDGDDSESAPGAWRFEDDRGKTARARRTPRRIVAYVGSAAALYDYGVRCTAVFGPSDPVHGRPNPQAGRLRMKGLTDLGSAWGEFDIERYAALKPELLISNMLPPPDLWFVPKESAKKILALAPGIGIKTSHTTLSHPLRRYEQLAAALGADVRTQKVKAAKARFKRAEEELRKAARDRPGLKVMAVTGDTDNMYVAVPGPYCDLVHYRELGVDLVEGRKSDKWGFWEFLSWENAGKYHADLILIDNREAALTPEDLERKPTWRELPAVRAGQTMPWAMEERYSYEGYAPVLESLAEGIRKARPLR
ncbi:ABC transporter substrate-binding protein [Streptomyces sp. HNM0575]|nr:ABC transporter substrate-binding protein [Streptomyces sp. HNM0575]